MTEVAWHYQRVANGRVLAVYDDFNEESPTMTVTNAVDIVLKELRRHNDLTKVRVIYQDTQGTWDEIELTPSGLFKGFKPNGALTLSRALNNMGYTVK